MDHNGTLEYSVCIIYFATSNEEYIIIDTSINLMAAGCGRIFYFAEGVDEKCAILWDQRDVVENAPVCFATAIPPLQSKTQMTRNKERKWVACVREWWRGN